MFSEAGLNLRLANYKHPIFNINNYANDEFVKVCDVITSPFTLNWSYINTNEDILYSKHRSWFYFIVLGQVIAKGGESGNVLAVRSYKSFDGFVQPKASSCGRLGRLINGDGTDCHIRNTLFGYQQMGYNVSIWVKSCPIHSCSIIVGGRKILVASTIHKEIEREYLSRFRDVAGLLPMCNKAEK